jgi:hypothetical protein
LYFLFFVVAAAAALEELKAPQKELQAPQEELKAPETLKTSSTAVTQGLKLTGSIRMR